MLATLLVVVLSLTAGSGLFVFGISIQPTTTTTKRPIYRPIPDSASCPHLSLDRLDQNTEAIIRQLFKLLQEQLLNNGSGSLNTSYTAIRKYDGCTRLVIVPDVWTEASGSRNLTDYSYIQTVVCDSGTTSYETYDYFGFPVPKDTPIASPLQTTARTGNLPASDRLVAQSTTGSRLPYYHSLPNAAGPTMKPAALEATTTRRAIMVVETLFLCQHGFLIDLPLPLESASTAEQTTVQANLSAVTVQGLPTAAIDQTNNIENSQVSIPAPTPKISALVSQAIIRNNQFSAVPTAAPQISAMGVSAAKSTFNATAARPVEMANITVKSATVPTIIAVSKAISGLALFANATVRPQQAVGNVTSLRQVSLQMTVVPPKYVGNATMPSAVKQGTPPALLQGNTTSSALEQLANKNSTPAPLMPETGQSAVFTDSLATDQPNQSPKSDAPNGPEALTPPNSGSSSSSTQKPTPPASKADEMAVGISESVQKFWAVFGGAFGGTILCVFLYAVIQTVRPRKKG